MQPFGEGVRDLHERVARLDELLTVQVRADVFREKRADAAVDRAEKNTVKIRQLWTAGLLVTLLWTPTTAYGAVWMHEKIRNNCYPGAIHIEGPPPGGEAWYCGIFPGTDRLDAH